MWLRVDLTKVNLIILHELLTRLSVSNVEWDGVCSNVSKSIIHDFIVAEDIIQRQPHHSHAVWV